jgi:hypothetical protein
LKAKIKNKIKNEANKKIDKEETASDWGSGLPKLGDSIAISDLSETFILFMSFILLKILRNTNFACGELGSGIGLKITFGYISTSFRV